MTDIPDQLVVRSHVARDLLQTAGLFKNERAVVWEYVVNGLQYVDPGTNPVVRVTIDTRRKRITIADNGRGMDWAGLHTFFVMHGENQDRKQGRGGRGRFGTGKSAAFGIASVLRVTTVRSRKRTRVSLNRAAVEAMSSGDEIPVQVVEREVRCNELNGTRVDIEQVHLRSVDQAGIIHYIERHLARWPRNVTVWVNNHECEISEPPVASERVFRPVGPARDALGDVELVLKVSKRALEEDERGVAVCSHGVWHETTLAGSEGREMAQYIFGSIDVPRLDQDESPVSPFNVSRSMQLNASNDLVREIYAFIHESVEQVRRELVAAEKLRKADEEARKLDAQAQEIAEVINEDFADFRSKVAKVRSKALGSVDRYRGASSAEGDEPGLVLGDDIPVTEQPTGDTGTTAEGSRAGGTEPRELTPAVAASENGEQRGDHAGTRRKNRHSRGGFRVEFENAGGASNRAKYVSDERTIYINLDHPQLVAAKGSGSVDEHVFRRLAYEVAFTEYAVALAMELAQVDGYYIDPTDPIFDISETVNRLARKGAHLYAATS